MAETRVTEGHDELARVLMHQDTFAVFDPSGAISSDARTPVVTIRSTSPAASWLPSTSICAMTVRSVTPGASCRNTRHSGGMRNRASVGSTPR